MGRPPAKIFWDTGGDKRQYWISETQVVFVLGISLQPGQISEFSVSTYSLYGGSGGKLEAISLSGIWLDCCEWVDKVPFKPSRRKASVCSWFILKQLALPQLGRT